MKNMNKWIYVEICRIKQTNTNKVDILFRTKRSNKYNFRAKHLHKENFVFDRLVVTSNYTGRQRIW